MRKIKEYFELSRGEQRGIIILFVLIIIVAFAPKIIDVFIEKPISWDYKLDTSPKLDSIVDSNVQVQKFQGEIIIDPNNASIDELVYVIKNETIARRIIKYRNTGATFSKKSDIKKIYGVNDSIYASISSSLYIKLQTKKVSPKKVDNKQKEKVVEEIYFEPIDINSIDSTTLTTIKGIGPVFASRIIKYRNLLGGFYSKDQLLEVYGINNDSYHAIESKLTINTRHVDKINLNTATFKELNKHPYISYNQTKSILRYRKLMSEFKNTDEIIANNLMDSSEYCKLKPYIITE